jgi:hypothetical protein
MNQQFILSFCYFGHPLNAATNEKNRNQNLGWNNHSLQRKFMIRHSLGIYLLQISIE